MHELIPINFLLTIISQRALLTDLTYLNKDVQTPMTLFPLGAWDWELEQERGAGTWHHKM
jgi:hypothetical protein